MSTRREFLCEIGAAGGALLIAPGCSDEPLARSARALPDFFWGVGIENTWMMQADPAIDGPRRPLDELALTQHYQRWREDLTLAGELGASVMRYGVPWPLAEPEPGVYDWSRLEGPIELLGELGIVPVLDLVHYGTPVWMKHGISDARFPEALAAYAAASADHFRGALRCFTPHNEPQVAAAFCGGGGVWPPYQKSLKSWAELGVTIARAMVLATRRLRDTLSEATIVSADPINWLLADALFPNAKLTLDAPELERLRAEVGSFPASLAYGTLEPEGVFGRGLIELGIAESELAWFRERAEPPDVFGYNHYPDIVDFAAHGDFTQGGAIPLAEAARTATERVELGLRRAHAYFERPIALSETSAGLSVEARAAYVVALGELRARLLALGVPLVGINWWPLFQAAQWAYRDRPELPLSDFLVPGGWNNGLYDLNAALDRVKTPAAEAFGALIVAER